MRTGPLSKTNRDKFEAYMAEYSRLLNIPIPLTIADKAEAKRQAWELRRLTKMPPIDKHKGTPTQSVEKPGLCRGQPNNHMVAVYITSGLRDQLASQKPIGESYGDFLQKLLKGAGSP